MKKKYLSKEPSKIFFNTCNCIESGKAMQHPLHWFSCSK
jgi:hypothetical protein